MQAEHVLKQPLNVLTEGQRASYFDDGYLVLPDYVPASWLSRLNSAMAPNPGAASASANLTRRSCCTSVTVPGTGPRGR